MDRRQPLFGYYKNNVEVEINEEIEMNVVPTLTLFDWNEACCYNDKVNGSANLARAYNKQYKPPDVKIYDKTEIVGRTEDDLWKKRKMLHDKNPESLIVVEIDVP